MDKKENSNEIKFDQLSFYEKGVPVDTNVKINNGDMLEFRMQRLLFFMGYYTKRGIIVKTSADDFADEITDLDAYGIYVHKDFSSKRIWADCKSGKAKPLERISWIKGVRTSVRIDDTIFVKSGVRVNTKQFARRNGILVLDNVSLTKLEKDFCVEENDWRGSWNYCLQKDMVNTLKRTTTYDGRDLKRIAQFIESNYWIFDPYARIKKCISGIRQLHDNYEIAKGLDAKVIKWAIFEMTTLFTLAAFNICREVYYLSDNDKKVIIEEGMISGEISAKKRAEIVDATYKMAIGLVKQQIPDFQPVQLDTGINIMAPEYNDKFIDLVSRITNNPLGYFDVLRALDFILMEYDLNEKPIDEDEVKKLFDNFNQIKGGIKTILHFVCDVSGIPTSFFRIIAKKE